MSKYSLKLIIYLLIVIFSCGVFVASQVVNNISSAAKKATAVMLAKHAKEISTLKIKHKQELTKVKLKQRSKAKVQRAIAAVPLIGLGFMAMFEKLEFDDWKKENPEGSFDDYSKEMSRTIVDLFSQE